MQSLLIQIGAKEALIAENPKQNDLDLLKLVSVLERTNIVITERKRSEWNAKDIDQDLDRLLSTTQEVTALRQLLPHLCHLS